MGKKGNRDTVRANEEMQHKTGEADPTEEGSSTAAEGDGMDKLAEAEKKAAENYDKYVRAVAELDNYRKRALREKADAINYGNETLLRDFLPLVDSVDRALEHADSVVVGEAELVWRSVLADAEQHRLQPVYKADRPVDMGHVAVPCRHLLDRNMYSTGFYTIQATRGCPYNCEYCAVSAFFGRGYRTRPVAQVIEEIKTFDTKNFFFVDDNITGKSGYAKELFRALVPLKRTWGGQTSINIAKDDELLSLYAKSGGRYAFIGFESLSEQNLSRMNKSWNSPETYVQAIKKIHKKGINILGSFIFGLDDDDDVELVLAGILIAPANGVTDATPLFIGQNLGAETFRDPCGIVRRAVVHH